MSIESGLLKKRITEQLKSAIRAMQVSLDDATRGMDYEYSRGSIDVLNKLTQGFSDASRHIGAAIDHERELAALEQKESM